LERSKPAAPAVNATACNHVLSADLEEGKVEECELSPQTGEAGFSSALQYPEIVRQVAGNSLDEEEVDEREAARLGEMEMKVVIGICRPWAHLAQQIPDLS
jgi:hypothetical protein